MLTVMKISLDPCGTWTRLCLIRYLALKDAVIFQADIFYDKTPIPHWVLTSHDIGWIPGKNVGCLDQGAVQWQRWDSSYPGRSLLVPRPKSSLVHCSNPSLSSTLQGSTTLKNKSFLSEQIVSALCQVLGHFVSLNQPVHQR